jgi:tetratricopeptide (TPR) repeat protein
MKVIYSAVASLAIMAVSVLSGCTGPQTFDELMTESRSAVANQEYEKAREYLGRAIQLQPSNREASYLLGFAYHRDLIFDSAMFYYRRVTIFSPDDREANLMLQEVARASLEWDIAIDAIKSLIRTGDDESLWLADMVDLHTVANRAPGLYYYGTKLLAIDSSDPELYIKVGTAMIVLDSLDQAVALMDRAIARFGETEELSSRRATFAAMAGQLPMAEEQFRELVEMFPGTTEHTFGLAKVLSIQKERTKKQEALDLLESIHFTEHDPAEIDSMITSLKEQLGK